MTERRTLMRPVRVERLCTVDGCAGTLEFAGQAITTLRTEYQHRCQLCGHMEWLDQSYPHIEHIHALEDGHERYATDADVRASAQRMIEKHRRSLQALSDD